MRSAIPDGTNIIKVRLHAKPVKYRRPPSSSSSAPPSLRATRLPRRDLSVLATEGLDILYSSFPFDNPRRLTCAEPSNVRVADIKLIDKTKVQRDRYNPVIFVVVALRVGIFNNLVIAIQSVAFPRASG